jgi:SynChlorMet cassette protein ScmC
MPPIAHLPLADGTVWDIAPGDEQASVITSAVREAMELGPASVSEGVCESPMRDTTRWLLVRVDDRRATWTTLPEERDGRITCVVGPPNTDDLLAVHLVRLSRVIVAFAEARGGVLLHGALAERDGYGVLLAGPAGVGKTTASQRLPSPWQSLCDDTTLVVRGQDGVYRAHPWPTWSRFMLGGPGSTCDVQRAVLLKGIFFLVQSGDNRGEPLNAAQTTCLLVESAEQIWASMLHELSKQHIRSQRLGRFANVCALARAVPSYHLRLSLTSPFWKEIERVIDGAQPVP